MVVSIKNRILSKNNFTFKEKLEISNLFSNINNKKNLIVPFNITNDHLFEIFSNYNSINIRRLKITDNINLIENTKNLFLFAFLKDSDNMIDKYNRINNNIKTNTNINSKNYFHTLKRSYINEGIYIVEVC